MLVPFLEKQTKDKGLGVFAKSFIPKGTVVWRLTNPVRVSKDEYSKLPKNIKNQAYPEGDHFVYSLCSGEAWNHSCDANTWWTKDNELSARRDIKEDEEITYDYATTDIDPDVTRTWQCKCGSIKCRHNINWNDILLPELYEEYKGHLPSFVEKMVRKYN